jgi:cytochrome c556
VLIKLAWDGFEPRTQDVKSRALPAIYGEPAKFKAAQDTMFAAMDKLVAAAKSGNEANVKVAVIDAGDACNNCHDTFRAKQQ